ncbi:MAG: alpha,alpha-trehalose-phosphate synthase (UDP-forming) [Terriglobales bacterium]|nr:trehalose-6-phosphate synthase [Terriglobales bacterium]
MRLLSVRLIVSLIVGVTLVSLFSAYYEVRQERQGLRNELERRAELLGESLVGNIEPRLEKGSIKEIKRMVERFSNREHLAGLAVFNAKLEPIAASSRLTKDLAPESIVVPQAITQNAKQSQFVRRQNGSLYIHALPLHQQDQVVGELVIVHDASYINAQSIMVWRETFLRSLVQVVLIALTTLLIVRWSITGPIARAAQWMKALRVGRAAGTRAGMPDLDLLRPLAREMETLAESLTAARSAAEKEAQLREAGESLWTAERLSVHVRGKLANSRLFVVSNREPFSHVRKGNSVQAIVPASGLVTALQPVLSACDGTWVAHGNGDADLETVDSRDRLRVPPQDPKYTLRRVWLTKEEEEGYYYGFANEGLWPLCHIAHTRPMFRVSDWEHYAKANQKFAKAVLDEMSGTEAPVLLVQDYHFGLLPRLVKKARPDARVAIFWHIPWPNPETFGICPWQRELLEGLLGADLIGFHIQSHCTNFLQTVDRTLESRIDWEHFAVDREEHHTVVKPFPISVDVPGGRVQPEQNAYMERVALLQESGVEALFLGVGVDRVDYTKGILERFLAIERMLEKYPVYREKFTFVQIGAPSRTHIKRYHDFLADVEAESERINWRFQTGKWKPIVFLNRQHSHAEIERYYRSADVCLVTSLHDGMNLVAKEFVAARDDDQGVLVLSRFTGASRELRDAVLVNPYDIERTAEAIRYALEMDPEERTARMQRLRKVVKEQNIYRWAANLIAELCDVRLDSPSEAELASRRAGSSR